MSTFSEQSLQEKIARLSSSQDSIETLSLWIIHHRVHAATSVEIWLRNFVESDADKRLLLIYLANDVLQNSRRRGADVFLDVFRAPLRHAAALTHGQKFQTSVERVLRIWKERRVYENRFLKELHTLIEPGKIQDIKDEPTQSDSDFKLPLLEDSMTELRKFEGELRVKSARLSSHRIDISDTSSLLMLKDKSAGDQFLSQFDESMYKLQEIVECVGIEVNERKNILDMLQDCRLYQLQNKDNLQALLTDYQQLKHHFLSLQKQVQERKVELEKAKHTATSDPASQKDITVAGDMEIDSDSESQEEPVAMHVHHPPPPPPAPFVPINHPSFPQMFPHPLPPTPPPPGRGILPTPPHLHIASPQGPPPYAAPLPPLPTPPPRLPPLHPPHPFHGPPPHIPPSSRMPLGIQPPIQNMPPFPLPPPAVDSQPLPPSTAPLPPSLSNAATQSHISPPSLPSTQPPPMDSSNGDDKEASILDSRLKDFATQKAFPKSLLTGYSDSSGSEGEEDEEEEMEEKLYGPSEPGYGGQKEEPFEREAHLPLGGPKAVPANAPMAAMATNSNISLPPPPLMFSSSSSSSPSFSSGVSTGAPQLILDSVAHSMTTLTTSLSSSPAFASTVSTSPLSTTASSSPLPSSSVRTLKSQQLNPEDIKITPSLTSVLNNIFPQLSKSLESERKRKLEGGATDSASKSPKHGDRILRGANHHVGVSAPVSRPLPQPQVPDPHIAKSEISYGVAPSSLDQSRASEGDSGGFPPLSAYSSLPEHERTEVEPMGPPGIHLYPPREPSPPPNSDNFPSSLPQPEARFHHRPPWPPGQFTAVYSRLPHPPRTHPLPPPPPLPHNFQPYRPGHGGDQIGGPHYH